MAAWQNHINEMQEHLQAGAPSLGCRPEELWEWEVERCGEQSFRARVVLLSIADPTATPAMPWGDTFVGKKPAKQDAARKALLELQRTRLRPHDAFRTPLAVPVSGGGGSGSGSTTSGTGHRSVTPMTLPKLPAAVLEVEPVVCSARGAGVSITAGVGATRLGEYDLSFDAFSAAVRSSATSAADTGMRPPPATMEPGMMLPATPAPPNLGELGEEFAVAWLGQQPFVRPGSVQWLNGERDAGEDHDIECEPLAEPGRRNVEVKTRWRKCSPKMSARQLQRLLDPDDDYMLLVVGNFHRLYDPLPGPPDIRVLLNPAPAVTTTATTATSVFTTANTKFEGGLSYASRAAAVAAAPPAPPPVWRLASFQVKPMPKQRQASASLKATLEEAEAMVGRVLDTTGCGGSPGFGVLSGTAGGGVPAHIVEYVTAAGELGWPGAVERHWQQNRKRLCRIAGSSHHTDPTQLATEMLLQLSAEMAGLLQPQIGDPAAIETEVRVDPADGVAYPLQLFLDFYGADEGLMRWKSLA